MTRTVCNFFTHFILVFCWLFSSMLFSSKLYANSSTQGQVQQYGPIKKGMTISLIAQELRPDTTFSINKTAKYLYKKNLKAFSNSSMNSIKLGSFLDIPPLNINKLRKNSYLKQLKSEQENEVINTSADIIEGNNAVVSPDDKAFKESTNKLPEILLPELSQDLAPELVPTPVFVDESKSNADIDKLSRQSKIAKSGDVMKKLELVENLLKQSIQQSDINRLQIDNIKGNIEKLNTIPFSEINLAQVQLTNQLLSIENRHISAFYTLLVLTIIGFFLFILIFLYLRKISLNIKENGARLVKTPLHNAYYTSGRTSVLRRGDDVPRPYGNSGDELDEKVATIEKIDFSHLNKK